MKHMLFIIAILLATTFDATAFFDIGAPHHPTIWETIRQTFINIGIVTTIIGVCCSFVVGCMLVNKEFAYRCAAIALVVVLLNLGLTSMQLISLSFFAFSCLIICVGGIGGMFVASDS